jgi:hypothetical protein
MDDQDRLSRVSSLYGPGTVSGWLCTVLSLLIAWTTNSKRKTTDDITNDMIAALSLPAVASVHLLFELRQFHGSIRELLTSQDGEVLQYLTAVEAPLNICETFTTIALPMVGVSAWYNNRKRATVVVILGIWCLLVEFVLFVGSYGATPATFNLSRAYLFTFPQIMITRGVTTVLALVVFLTCMVISSLKEPLDPEEIDQRRVKKPNAYAMRIYSWIPLAVALPFGIIISVAKTDVLKLYARTHLRLAAPNLFFIPSSTSSISDLDQAVALAAGTLTIAFSIYGSIKDHRHQTFEDY